VFEGAEAMAEAFRQRITSAEAGFLGAEDADLVAAQEGFSVMPADFPCGRSATGASSRAAAVCF